MGVENADDAATWKASMSILRRQKLLPLLEEVDARGEEDTISIFNLQVLWDEALRVQRIQKGVYRSAKPSGSFSEQDGDGAWWVPRACMFGWFYVRARVMCDDGTEDACSTLHNNEDLHLNETFLVARTRNQENAMQP